MKTIKSFGIFAATLVATASLTNAAAFVNGDFELPNLGTNGFTPAGNNDSTTITGWTAFTSGAGANAVYLASVPAPFIPTPTTGAQIVVFNTDDLGGTCSLVQTFDTIAGQSYTVGFDLGREIDINDPSSTGQAITVAVTGTAPTLVAAPDIMTAFTYSFVATGTSSTLTFSRVAGIGEDGNRSPALDSVTVTAVPEPTAALLGSFGALALLRRRRS
ncbi:MAG: DUF642 domain-containing protein [Armatimonadetes bacterium]|nr:DUF642 domain-containing protein [Akkermansiaceae bacterium]